MKETMQCAEVRFNLQPLQARAGAAESSQAGSRKRPAPTPQDDEPDKQLRTIVNLQASIENLIGSTSNSQRRTTGKGQNGHRPEPTLASDTENLCAVHKNRPASGGQERPAKQVSLAGERLRPDSSCTEEARNC